MAMTTKDMQIMRQLAAQYMEVATLPVQREKMELWKSLNRFDMKRPMVVIDQLPINELNGKGELTCFIEDPFWRDIEHNLRLELYRFRHFPVDMVLEPFITIPKAVTMSNYGLSIKEDIAISDPSNDVVGHLYKNQLTCMEDVLKITDVTVTHDEKLTLSRMQEADLVFGGIAPILASGGVKFHLGVWDYLSMLMGVQEVYYTLVDAPELLHAAMRRVTDSIIAGIKQANELGVVADNAKSCHCSYIYSDELLPDFGAGRGPNSKNTWGFGMAQLFSSVSPDVTEEFELPYITEIAEYFGGIYYGCCERLDDRLDMIKTIPNLQKISCSPWSKKDVFAQKIGRNLIMSNKPSPAYLVMENLDEDVIRKDLMETMNIAKANNVNLEFILKDISTALYQPERITRWGEIAMEVVNNY